MDKPLLEQARAELTDARRALADSGGGHPNAFTRAAQIALVAQAEAAHRQADALERVAAALEAIAGCVDDDGPTIVVRQQGDPLERLATVFEEAHA